MTELSVTELSAAGISVLSRAEWPEAGDDPVKGPPKLAGFVVSSFAPLAAEAAERCLRRAYGEPPAQPGRDRRTAVLVVSKAGDTATDRAVAKAVDAGRSVQPLLFFQSVPNAVIGYVAKRWGLVGPVVCLSPAGDPEQEALATADLLLLDDAADDALIVLLELASEDGAHDTATALLVGPGRANEVEA
ncbi:hypothetical protein SNS2_2028 [Streptomyces netropsis]|uniref:3-oxoacyl-(Acyl-carrier-protein) synthase n=1 Tax=Streptomyces syringium TaxID=76729 RepID=A0ABS4Y636_9ACTN|nr:hypothetical protein [Streptomyces syringium]MBP2404243.1 3-oxoacyl-(acyl-carrier-protein) synthase [Streptomyces syringium]SPE53563.1 hypothetical protein SNS2_2028 [Streptomyces netropsis]